MKNLEHHWHSSSVEAVNRSAEGDYSFQPYRIPSAASRMQKGVHVALVPPSKCSWCIQLIVHPA